MPLEQGVYRDNIDVDMRIDGDEWNPIDVKVELSKYTSPDYVDFIAVPAPEAELPPDPPNKKENGGLLGTEFTIGVDTDIVSERDLDVEEQRIFTGVLSNLSTAAEGGWEGLAHDPSHQAFSAESSGSFYNQQIDISQASGAESLQRGFEIFYSVEYSMSGYNRASGAKISASDLAEFVLDEAPIDEYKIKLSDSGSGPSRNGEDTDIYLAETNISVSTALDRIEKVTDSARWFDIDGVFYIGAPEPDVDIYKHDLRFITDTTAGMQTPPYQSVRVIGSGVASEEGWRRTNLNADEKIKKEVDLSESAAVTLAEPTFEYRNMSLTTQKQIEKTTNRILDELRSQQAKGEVTVVGMPEVRPLDAIVLPNTEQQPMGGKVYGVTKVVHSLNNSDGFSTTIHVSFPMNIQEGLFDTDVQSLQETQRENTGEPIYQEGGGDYTTYRAP